MAHCHSNHPIFCCVCDAPAPYGDESGSSFCSEICEREWEDYWEECDTCKESTRKDKMVHLVGGKTVCPSCFDDIPEGTDYDERDQT